MESFIRAQVTCNNQVGKVTSNNQVGKPYLQVGEPYLQVGESLTYKPVST